MEIKIGEAQGRMFSDINRADNPRVLLRVVYKNKTEEVPIKLSKDLKNYDQIKVTVVKISEAPKAEDKGDATAEQD